MERMNERTRTTSPPASGVRVSAWRAVAVLACAAVALVVSFLCSREALASDYQDVWNHQSIDGGQQYIVGAYNPYDAAAFVCGYSSSTVGGWDLPTLGKLSNAPAIVALADSFGNVTPWNDDLLRDTCEQFFGTDLWNKMQSTYGGVGGIHVNAGGLNPVQLKYWQDNMPAGMHVYALNTNSEAVGAAKESFRAILAGEDIGGGGVVDGVVTFSGVSAWYDGQSSGSTSQYVMPSSGGGYYRWVKRWTTNNDAPYIAAVTSIDVPFDLVPTFFERFPSDSYTYYIKFRKDSGQARRLNIEILASRNAASITTVSSIFNGSTVTVNDTITSNGGFGRCVFNADAYYDGEFVLTGVVGTPTITDASDGTYSLSNSVGSTGTTYFLWQSGGGGGGGDEPDPPNNWPDDGNNTTVAPSPPELPTPKDPTVPTEPDPDPPYYYTPPTPDPPSPDPPYEPIEPTGTSPTDYTPWLRAILLALGGISSDMATHCQHLQAQMKAQATRIIQGINNQLVNLGTSINGVIGDWAKWLGECWGEGLNTLTDNLYDLFHWLADQFDFTYSGDPYDDSGIIGWLRRIYNRLGNGGDPKHYAPTILDPGSEGEEEPFDFWAWLLERIAAILGGVLGGATDAVSTLLEGIRGKFPFSIPWDLLAFLGMLSGDRAIPVFTFTIPAIQGWWDDVPIRVDLTPYDSAAQACRTMVLIWWAFILAMKSTWMINDVLGAVGSSIVSRFTGRLVGTAS